MEVHLLNGRIIKNVIHISQLNGEMTITYNIIKSTTIQSEIKIKCIEIDSIELK